MMSDPATEDIMHPYITERLAEERVETFHREAAAGRRARRARRARPARSAKERHWSWTGSRSGGGGFPSQLPPPDRWATREL
jgi:hypothetical protein